jgi:hypothetical protein
MPIFMRRPDYPIKKTDYRQYKPLVREDFCECCAYCLLNEFLAGGEDNFELDHFHPRSKPTEIDDVNDFYNLYYSCHVCNHYKAHFWPDDGLQKKGYRFVDPCRDEFSTHFRAEDTGRWAPLTPAGEYSEARLRLNRTHLVEVRMLLDEIARLRGKASIDWGCPTREQIADLLPKRIL